MRPDRLEAERRAMREARLPRLLVWNFVIGAFVAVAVVTTPLASDTQGLLGVVRNDAEPLLAVPTCGFVMTFGSAAMEAAVMSLSLEERLRRRRAPLPLALRPALAPDPRSPRPRGNVIRRDHASPCHLA